MEVFYIRVQHLSQVGKPVCVGLPSFTGSGTGHRQGIAKLRAKRLFGRLVRMKLQTEGAQPHIRQALVHHIERRPLLGHEQHPFAGGQAVSDQVGDCLGFSGTRRALQHERSALRRRIDGTKLGGIGMERTERHRWWIAVVEEFHLGKRRLRFEPLARCLDQMTDNRIPFEFFGVGLQVEPHQEPGECQCRETGPFFHLPSGFTFDRVADDPQNIRHIQTGIVFGQRIQAIDGDTEIHFEFLEQGDVDTRLFVNPLDAKAIAYRRAFDIHGNQKNGRTALDVTRCRFGPDQKAKNQKQRIRAPFFQSQTGGALDLGKSIRQFLFRHGSMQPPLRHFLTQVIGQRIPARLPAIQRGITGIARSPGFRLRAHAKHFAGSQRIVKAGNVRTEQRDGFFGFPEVEQTVSQRKIEQTGFPSGKAVGRTLPIARNVRRFHDSGFRNRLGNMQVFTDGNDFFGRARVSGRSRVSNRLPANRFGQ